MPRVRRNIFGDRLAQLRQPRRGAVMREALVERLLGRLDHMGGRLEIRLADFQVNHICGPALRARARATSTSKADSVRSRDIRSASFMIFENKERRRAASVSVTRSPIDDALAVDARGDAAAVFSITMIDLIGHIRRKALGREMNHGFGVNSSGRACSVPPQDGNHAGAAAAAQVLREAERVPLQLPLARFAAHLLHHIANLRHAGAPTGWPFDFKPPLALIGMAPSRRVPPSQLKKPAAPAFHEPQIFHRDNLGDREAIVQFGEFDLASAARPPCR